MSLTFRGRGAALLLLLLLVLGLGLRVQNLDHKGLGADELFSLAIAQYYPFAPIEGQPFYRQIDVLNIGDGDTFLTAKAAEQSPPLNDLMEKASVRLLGPTELAARLPAVLAAGALLLWFAWFAWRHPDPYVRRVLAWGLLLLLLYPALIVYAQDARTYSLGVSTVGMAGLLWMLRWRDGWRAWKPTSWAEIGLFTLACYSHYNAAMLVSLLLVCDAVVATKLRSGRGWGRLLTLGLIFSVWLTLNAHTIVFTSEGGVAWAHMGAADRVRLTLEQAPEVMFPYWLVFASAVLAGLLTVRWRRGAPLWPAENGVARLSGLAALTLLYVAFAGFIAAKAGMAHPRYYIFVLPFVAVMMGMVFAEIRQRWLMAAAALILAALAAPAIRAIPSMPYEDFRAMTLYGVKASDNATLFLYPWVPNRNTYRVYLERYLGGDARSRMVGISTPQETGEVCQRLTGHPVVVLAHDSGKSLIDAVYAACGTQWPQRHREPFIAVFAEHWKAP